MTSKGGGKDRSKQFDIHLDRNSTVGKIICDISSGCLSSRRSVENELDRREVDLRLTDLTAQSATSFDLPFCAATT